MTIPSRPLLSLLFFVLSGCTIFSHRTASPVIGTWRNDSGDVWTILGNGTFEVDVTADGRRDAWGRYHIKGDTITLMNKGAFVPKRCKSGGVYHFQVADNTLRFILVNDECKVRRKKVLMSWSR